MLGIPHFRMSPASWRSTYDKMREKRFFPFKGTSAPDSMQVLHFCGNFKDSMGSDVENIQKNCILSIGNSYKEMLSCINAVEQICDYAYFIEFMEYLLNHCPWGP